MTTASSMYMETVSLNDDAPAGSSAVSSTTVLDVDSLEAQFAQPTELKAPTPEMTLPVSDSDSDEDGNDQNKDVNVRTAAANSTQNDRKGSDDAVVLDVDADHKESSLKSSNGNQQQHVLPPLRVLTQRLPVEERDYVDPTRFSPEVSRHAMEVAHRRAKAIANEVKEMIELEDEMGGAVKVKMSPVEAVSIIGGAFASSLKRAKKMVKPGTKEYDLLSGVSPSAGMSKLDDLDTDGDGLQLSPDGDGQHFRTPKLRPALKRFSAYTAAAALEPEKKTSSTRQKKKGIQWHEDVLDADEEFYEDDSDELETHSLMNGEGDAAGNGNGSPRSQILNYSSKNDGQLTPRSKKKRKKLVRSMMRRLTPREKEELYRQRPDLMIIPNWAQKYREEISGEDSTRWNAWLLGLISVLAVLLLVFILLIVRQRAAAST